MNQVAYLYLPVVSRKEAGEILYSLQPFGFQVTRIGKDDPPKKRQVSLDDAIELILHRDRKDSANWTFVEDEGTTIVISFEIRTDPMWGFSTVSISFPHGIPAKVLCKDIFQRTQPFACISGREGAGKEQEWEVILIKDDCPGWLKNKLLGT